MTKRIGALILLAGLIMLPIGLFEILHHNHYEITYFIEDWWGAITQDYRYNPSQFAAWGTYLIVTGLLLSYLYDKGLGRLAYWIRTGQLKKTRVQKLVALAKAVNARKAVKSNVAALSVNSLSPTAEFFDVEGIPVSLGEPLSGVYSAAWDTTPPRGFNPDSARRNGAPISAAVFVRLVAASRTGKPEQSRA